MFLGVIMKKLILGLVTLLSATGMIAQTVERRRVAIYCGDGYDWQTLSPLKWQQIKCADQNAKNTAQAAKALLHKLDLFETELEEWLKNIFHVNSYPNPNNIEDEKEKRELLQKIKNDPFAIIKHVKRGYQLADDLASITKNCGSIGIEHYIRYLQKNLREKVQAFNTYYSTHTTSSQREKAHGVLVKDFNPRGTVSEIRMVLQKYILNSKLQEERNF